MIPARVWEPGAAESTADSASTSKVNAAAARRPSGHGTGTAGTGPGFAPGGAVIGPPARRGRGTRR